MGAVMAAEPGLQFDFLPNLPKANLDDRTFADLVEECLLRIPRYCPEWTNYNPSDPGVTLIELFAWLTEQMLVRFNQVPRRHYVAFLELLGVRLQPPNPARTELTFYLISELPQRYVIPQGIEAATERTVMDEAIVFSTDQPLVIDVPRLSHCLTADTPEPTPQTLRDRFAYYWQQDQQGHWGGPELPLFQEQPQVGNCFYLVFDPEAELAGNVLALRFQGRAATPTGINPQTPPRVWEAWTGKEWVRVLRREGDDATQGFSFYELAQSGGNPLQGVDVLVHLPPAWPVTQFTSYRGRWLRCIYQISQGEPGYSAAPRVVGMQVRSLGGMVAATQCQRVEMEVVGVSDGTPGQRFQLKQTPVLQREAGEELLVTLPSGLVQSWQEVTDFASSGAEDLHYTLDGMTGTVQFGPLVREASQLVQQTQERAAWQRQGTGGEFTAGSLEFQYGAIPPRGATLRMARYRTGGGAQGNVQSGAVRVLKSAVPYVVEVVNHPPATQGTDGESLEQAVIRVPRLLRSRNRAVTPEDFEVLTLEAGQGRIARCHYVAQEQPGQVQLVVVPRVVGGDNGRGTPPERFALSPALEAQVLDYLQERKLLGVQVACRSADYVGVAVQVEVALQEAYRHVEAREPILRQIRTALYQFLHPLTGGIQGQGWPLGRTLYPADVVGVLQKIPMILYLGEVRLFPIQRRGSGWQRLPPVPFVDPGSQGLICSWEDSQVRSQHSVNLM